MHVTNRFNQRPLLKETGGMLFQMEPHLSITTLSISIPTSSNMATFILNCLNMETPWPKSLPKSHLLGLQTNKWSFLGELARLCHSKGEARYNTEKDLQVHSFQWSSWGLKFIGILQSRLKFQPPEPTKNRPFYGLNFDTLQDRLGNHISQMLSWRSSINGIGGMEWKSSVFGTILL